MPRVSYRVERIEDSREAKYHFVSSVPYPNPPSPRSRCSLLGRTQFHKVQFLWKNRPIETSRIQNCLRERGRSLPPLFAYPLADSSFVINSMVDAASATPTTINTVTDTVRRETIYQLLKFIDTRPVYLSHPVRYLAVDKISRSVREDQINYTCN